MYIYVKLFWCCRLRFCTRLFIVFLLPTHAVCTTTDRPICGLKWGERDFFNPNNFQTARRVTYTVALHNRDRTDGQGWVYWICVICVCVDVCKAMPKITNAQSDEGSHIAFDMMGQRQRKTMSSALYWNHPNSYMTFLHPRDKDCRALTSCVASFVRRSFPFMWRNVDRCAVSKCSQQLFFIV